MGLLTTYLAVKYGQKQARRRTEAMTGIDIEADLDDICDNCGFELFRHAPDEQRSCPNYGM
jgi:hypothetical protein